MQAIQTKYYGPTNRRGSRCKAWCQARTRFYTWRDDLTREANHKEAAKKLASELEWDYGAWVPGEISDGSTVFVCVTNDAISDGFILEKQNTLAQDLAERAPEDEIIWRPGSEKNPAAETF